MEEKNPDIMLYDQITGCDFSIEEDVVEAKHEKVACVRPWCGASTFPDELGRCEYYKGKVN